MVPSHLVARAARALPAALACLLCAAPAAQDSTITVDSAVVALTAPPRAGLGLRFRPLFSPTSLYSSSRGVGLGGGVGLGLLDLYFSGGGCFVVGLFCALFYLAIQTTGSIPMGS